MPVKGDLKQSEGYWNNFQAVKDSKCLNEDADEDEKSEDFWLHGHHREIKINMRVKWFLQGRKIAVREFWSIVSVLINCFSEQSWIFIKTKIQKLYFDA